MRVKLKQWAKDNGISYQTALVHFNEKKLGVDTFESSTGRKFVIVDEKENEIIKNIDASITLLQDAKEKLKSNGSN